MSKPNNPRHNDPLIGTTFAGRYSIERRLGRGGMGVVYRALQLDVRRKVVIKILAPDWVGDTEALARFEREASGLSSLQHPNIVTILDFGNVEGRAFIVMELVEGETLGQHVKRKERLELNEFVPIAAQVLKGLGEAHSRGIIHRDIKPSNIMLCERQGRANYVKILDFGLAKLVSGSSDITKQNVLGTPQCLSPEQIQGERADQRVDVYAVGILFYYMLSGVMPFASESDMSVLYKHVNEKPKPLSGLLPEGHKVPQGVVELIGRCLEKKRDDRPTDANEVVEGLIDQVPFSMFRLPRALPKSQRAEPEIEELDSEALEEDVPSPDDIQVGSFPRQPRAPSSTPSARVPVGVPPIPTQQPPPPGLTESQRRELESQGHSVTSSVIDPEGNRVVHVRSKNETPIMVGLAIVAVVLALFIILDDKDKGTEGVVQPVATAGPAPVADGSDGQVDVQAKLDEVRGLIDRGQVSQAKEILDTNEAAFAGAGMTKAIGEQRTRIVVFETMARAREFEQSGDTTKALAQYQAAYGLDPTNQDALAKIREFFGGRTPPAGKYGFITVNTVPSGASVWIDGKVVGNAPMFYPLSVGTYELEITAAGFESKTSQVTVGDSQDVPVEVSLEKKAGGVVATSPPQTPSNPSGTNTKKKKKKATSTNNTSTVKKTPPTTTKKKKKKSTGLLPT